MTISCSVIMPSIGRSTIWASLLSIARQSALPVEVIIICQSATLYSEILKLSGTGVYPVGIIAVHSPRIAPSSARNLGVSHSGAELITFLDDDDIWLPNHIANCISSCSHGFTVSYSYSVILHNNIYSLGHKAPAFPFLNKFAAAGCLPSWCIRTEIYNALNGFDIGLSKLEDLDFLRRYYLAFGPPFVRLQPSVLYMGVQPNRSSLTLQKNKSTLDAPYHFHALSYHELRASLLSSPLYPLLGNCINLVKSLVSPVAFQARAPLEMYVRYCYAIDTVDQLIDLLRTA